MTNQEQLKQLQEEEEIIYKKMSKIIKKLPEPQRTELYNLFNCYVENQLETEELSKHGK